jgi:ABC-type phosphate transport system permease subunit
MKLTRRKITTIILAVVTAGLIIYNIITLKQSPNDVISRVMYNGIWKFPAIIFGWFVLGSHFISPFKMKRQYIWLMVIISCLAFGISFAFLFEALKSNSLILCIFAFIGFLTGGITWSQRIKK